MSVAWERLFRPRCVALIGATDREGSQQRAQFVFLRERLGPSGCRIVPVHPTKPEVLGVPARRSVLDVEGDVDVAVVIVRDPVPALEQCVAKGVGFVILFSAGFAELGTDAGRAAECRVAELARAGTTRVVGPNTNLNVFERWRDLPGRRLAVVTQSGFQGRPIVQGEDYGIAIESWATLGNEADLEWADFVEHYVTRSGIGAVASYVEGFRSGASLFRAADAAARHGVPVVTIKVGRSAAGQAMAQAHTGHLAGADAVHDAAFEQAGIVRVDDIDELVEIGGMFCHVPALTGPDGIALYTLSGGTAAHLVDLCAAAGLPVPRFADATIDRLREHVGPLLRVDNPVDSGGTLASTPAGLATLRAALDDPHTNVLMVPITGVFPGMVEPLAADLVQLHREARKPVLVVWASPRRDSAGHRMLCEAGVPLFHSFGAAVRGAKALFDHRAFRTSYAGPAAVAPPHPDADAWRARLAAGRLDEVESAALLAAYGVPTAGGVVVTDAAAARAQVQRLGQAVLKIVSPDVAHKSDLGLVRVGVAPQDAAAVFDELIAAAPAEADVRGVLVQPLVTGAVAEVILGVTHSPPFGPVVMVGLGGVFAEVLGDVSFGVPPFGAARARRMVDRLAGAALLRGARGHPSGDVDALIDAILALQRLATDLGDAIAELDVNPLLVLPSGVVAVDALVVPSAQ